MAFYNPQKVNMKCSYEPCGHELTREFFNESHTNYDTCFCPKCNLFTLKPVILSLWSGEVDALPNPFKGI